MKNAVRKSRKFSFVMLLYSCAIMLLCSVSQTGAAELPKTAKLIPAETVVLVDIHDFSKLQTQFEKTQLYKLYKDPSMAAFINNFKSKWQEMKDKSDDEFARIFSDFKELPQGRAAIAVVLSEKTKDANEPPILFIAQWGSNAGKVKETMGKIVDKLVEDGGRVQSENYRGVDIKAVTDKTQSPLSYCFIDDCMIGSLDPETLKFVIAQVKGAGSPTLADDSDYNTCTRAVGPALDGQVNVYVNIKQIVKTIVAEDTEGQAKMFMANLGLDNVTSFAFSFDLAQGPGGSSFGKALLKIDGGKKGICKMLEVESAGVTPPRFASGSSSAMTFVNLNIGKAYNELAAIAASFSPQAAMMMNMPILPPSSPGEQPMQLKNGIIDYLGSQIVIAQSVKEPAAAGAMPAAESLVGIATNNRNALEKSLSLLHGMMSANNPSARRELLGHTIYMVDLAGLMPMLGGGGQQPMRFAAAPGMPQMPQAAFTVTDTHLIIGLEAAVEQAVRTLGSGQADSVASAKWFTKAKASIPSAVGVAGMQDNAAMGEFFWSSIKESQKAAKDNPGAVPGMGPGALPQMMMEQAGVDLFDFGLLPDFKVVRKYFGLSSFYGISREDGYFFEFKYLNSEGAE